MTARLIKAAEAIAETVGDMCSQHCVMEGLNITHFGAYVHKLWPLVDELHAALDLERPSQLAGNLTFSGHPRLIKAAEEAADLLKAVEEFRLDKDMEEHEKPFNVLDYFRFEHLGVELRAALAEAKAAPPAAGAEPWAAWLEDADGGVDVVRYAELEGSLRSHRRNGWEPTVTLLYRHPPAAASESGAEEELRKLKEVAGMALGAFHCYCGRGATGDERCWHCQLDAIVNPHHVRDDCEHQWVDARNEHVVSGEVCPKCGAMRAGKEPTSGK